MSYEHMNTVGYLVVLRLPDEIQPEQGIRELGTCITFGQPSISLQWSTPDGIPDGPEQTDFAEIWAAHRKALSGQAPEIDSKPFPEPYPLPDE